MLAHSPLLPTHPAMLKRVLATFRGKFFICRSLFRVPRENVERMFANVCDILLILFSLTRIFHEGFLNGIEEWEIEGKFKLRTEGDLVKINQA